MTDLRIPERYLTDRRVVRLGPVDFTSFIAASLWCVSNRTDGVLEPEDLALIPMFNKASIAALVERDLWRDTGNGWVVTDYKATQTSKHDLEVLERARRADREKKARQRAEKRSTSGATPSFSTDPGDGPRDMSPGGHRREIGRDNEALGDTSPLAQQALTAWGTSKSCAICLVSLPADYPSPVCHRQDDAHIDARTRSVA